MSFEVTFTLRDAYSRTTTRRMTCTASQLADAQTACTAMIGYLEALSNMAVIKTAIAVVDTYSTQPASGANVDAGGTLHARLNNGKLAPVHIPAIDASKVNADGSIILTDTAVTNLETALGPGGDWTISEGNTVNDFEYGELDR